MARLKIKHCFLFLLFTVIYFTGCSGSRFTHFISTEKDKLMEGDKEFRFVSFNIPNLHYVEDYFDFTSRNPWRLPDEYEIRDALSAIKQMGGKVARIYVLSVRKPGESKNIIRHVEAPGVFNEDAFRALDKVMEIANDLGVRIIIPFVDNWWWWGGPLEYAAFRGKEKEEFWTDPQLISDFKKTVEFIVNRKNSYTGTLYKDDKALFGWETGNELECPYSWTAEIAAYIKSMDQNHVVIEGTHSQLLTEEALNDTNIDVLSTHHYSKAEIAVSDIAENRKRAKERKPYFVGEFGLAPIENLKAIVDTAISNGVSGIMIWSLRFRNRDGGFYMHRENRGFGPYRFPGFATGDLYNEKEMIEFMMERAFEIDGKKTPPPEVPAPPGLLETEDIYGISWQGSAGASSYIVERKEGGTGIWIKAAEDIIDANEPYRPLFTDTSAVTGKEYYYRVSAKNQSGVSEPSNEIGPLYIKDLKLIDELRDSSEIFLKEGNVEFLKYKDIYRAKEDNSRLTADSGSYIIYSVPGEITGLKVFAFSDSLNNHFEISAAGSLNNFITINPKIETFPPYKNVYRFFTPVLYSADEFPENSRYIKIKFITTGQLSRVEIDYNTSGPEESEIYNENFEI